MYLMYGIGFAFYLSKFPESRWPGKFDIWFHSHQWWHVFVVSRAEREREREKAEKGREKRQEKKREKRERERDITTTATTTTTTTVQLLITNANSVTYVFRRWVHTFTTRTVCVFINCGTPTVANAQSLCSYRWAQRFSFMKTKRIEKKRNQTKCNKEMDSKQFCAEVCTIEFLFR